MRVNYKILASFFGHFIGFLSNGRFPLLRLVPGNKFGVYSATLNG
jgi:hypothetical protein